MQPCDFSSLCFVCSQNDSAPGPAEELARAPGLCQPQMALPVLVTSVVQGLGMKAPPGVIRGSSQDCSADPSSLDPALESLAWPGDKSSLLAPCHRNTKYLCTQPLCPLMVTANRAGPGQNGKVAGVCLGRRSRPLCSIPFPLGFPAG